MFAVRTKWRVYSLGLLIGGLMMSALPALCDEAALLAAIRAHPDEDTPRLAYADWLMEFGPSDVEKDRGEFIKLQVALAQQADQTSKNFVEMQTRAEALLKKHWEVWTPEYLHPLVRFSRNGPHPIRGEEPLVGKVWRRGFIEGVRLNHDHVRSPRLKDALEQLPVLYALELEGLTQAEWARLADQVPLSRIRHLRINQWLDTTEWLGISAKLERLESLAIPHLNHHLSAGDVISDLASSPHADRLRRLALPAHPSAHAAMAPILASTKLQKLETLVLNGISDLQFDLSALTADSLPALRNLYLYGFSAQALERVIEHPRFRTLSQFGFAPVTTFNLQNANLPRILERIAEVGENLVSVEVFGMKEKDMPAALQKRLDENRARVGCAAILSAF